jgi:hypothetical protein
MEAHVNANLPLIPASQCTPKGSKYAFFQIKEVLYRKVIAPPNLVNIFFGLAEQQSVYSHMNWLN